MADTYFFSPQDRERIRAAAGTEWGHPIVDAMREAVEERLTHSMEIPELESGHFHRYFCPTHNRMLTFDWDSPTRHYCLECDDFLTGKRYDDPWRRFIHGHNQVFLRNCTLLSIITRDQKYLEHIRELLLAYAERYPSYRLHGHDMKFDNPPYGGRMFSQTLDEANWVVDVAPAYLEALSVITPDEAKKIEEGLLRPLADTILRNQTGGNWQVWHNGGTASIAIALDDDEMLDIALNDPEHGYHAMMAKGVTADGWWYERSPGYHFYPLHSMVRTAEAVRCRGIDLWTPDLEALFVGPMKSVYADLSFPAHNDGWHGVSLTNNAQLYEVAALRFDDELLRNLLSHCYARRERNHWMALLHGREIEPDGKPFQIESCLYGDTGNAFLRSASTTVAFKFGPHGGGHGHPDKLSISIHDGHREILPDLGTPGYGVPDHIHWYRKTLAHNTVTVDGRDQNEAAGNLVEFKKRNDGGVVIAECDTAYEGITMRRSLDLSGKTLLDEFACEATAEHTYDYVLLLVESADVPDSATSAELPGGAGYDRIKNPVRWDPDRPVTFPIGNHSVELSSPQPVAIITGKAPGIPATFGSDDRLQPVYPLIVRTKGKSMKVQAVWTFGE